MYLDKPLAGHNLMQAIARVNRVYGEKPGGLIVDLLGLADQLADALATYTHAPAAPTGRSEGAGRGGAGDAVGVRDSCAGSSTASTTRAALDAEAANVLRVYLGAIDHVLRAGRRLEAVSRRW